MAKTIKEMIEIMEWFDKGGEVECTDVGIERWRALDDPQWNWDGYDYRIKKPKEKVTIEKWLIEMDDIKIVIETSDTNSWLKPFPTAKKLKLIESYEVEI